MGAQDAGAVSSGTVTAETVPVSSGVRLSDCADDESPTATFGQLGAPGGVCPQHLVGYRQILGGDSDVGRPQVFGTLGKGTEPVQILRVTTENDLAAAGEDVFGLCGMIRLCRDGSLSRVWLSRVGLVKVLF